MVLDFVTTKGAEIMSVPQDMTPDTQLTVAEIAEILEVTPRQVQYYAKGGAFPNARRVGRGKRAPYLIPWRDVQAFLEKK